MNTTDFQPGMTIYSRDGILLGRVQEIWAHTATHGMLPVSEYLLQDFGPIRGTTDLLTSSDGYLHVRGNRIPGEYDLYLPLASVQSIDSPTSATSKFPAQFCRQHHTALPQLVRQAA
jgi:hypothetical protein